MKKMSSYNMKSATERENGGCRLVRVKHLLPADLSLSSGRMVHVRPAGITVRKSAATQRNRVWICQRQSDIWSDSGVSEDGTGRQVNDSLRRWLLTDSHQFGLKL